MKSITISGSKRESVGKKATKALRNAGKVPCVLYGGETPLHFSADEPAFKNLVYTPNAHTAVIEIEGGNKFDAVLQDIQFHPVTDAILHIDFYQLFADKEVTMDIPVRLVGNSPGVRNGGRLLFRKRKLTIKALPAKLPDFFDIDISKLKIGANIAVATLLNDEFSILHPENTVVVQVKSARNAVVLDEEEEEGAEGAEGATEAAAE
ncbi:MULTISPECIES: 50S ribosomal protein L25/general stress protein Ctc [Cellulophaga]|jgi:large subunit ribosomal protein L25|uniref:Large ribosomal subunit protein bL25 n=1 Tax=Cellulophaga baltica 18 TaxID=1348584 RepID=A0AAU8RUG5_9FLAO|nr:MULTISPECIES: 50S ribosomal protein L25/general stress protein Ctc [Cellulophaga]WFO14707.1 50S ribosomal protein L25/general stress protein Ctc [Cellulophaga baltica 4]AIZ41324.1 50S ribosomal protein L25 [Cellulophaga baltica 18]KGK32044.1 50S ribosomal protein L25 [Cellulophaga sp. E6(2014)]MBA6313505.1 50S ribosomal protein L25/general stress protein Ctc [Cellulophaga baltica]MCR1023521.1 50S ribosomal protein L25/general stress protein Ctc [Cellulophaga baltica]